MDQLKERLQNDALTEAELRSELMCLQKERTEQNHMINSTNDKLKHLQKSVANAENERRLINDRLEAAQGTINELHSRDQAQQDVIQRLQNQIAELEVQKSTMDAQLRIAKWNQNGGTTNAETYDDIAGQLLKTQREKNELRLKVETLNEKLRHIENERFSKFNGERKQISNGEYDSNRMPESSARGKDHLNYKLEYSLLKQENHDLKIKIRRMETILAEKESEITRLSTKLLDNLKNPSDDTDKYRAAQLKLDAREQHHRQQITQLENQVRQIFI